MCSSDAGVYGIDIEYSIQEAETRNPVKVKKHIVSSNPTPFCGGI
jgi:hypothetical protein